MKYYEMHEVVYSKLKSEGALSWDRSKTFAEMWNHSTNTFLEKFLTNFKIKKQGLKVLDLGTGTGTSALYLAKDGAEVTGIEISPSALEIARSHALNLDLNVEFQAGDVLEINLGKKFDLAVDSTILHCLVGRDDRTKFYQKVKQHLNDDGFLFINTMVANDQMNERFSNKFFLFQDEVLWSLGISEIKERRIFDGQSYFPHRTLLSKEKQINEFVENGFEIVHLEDENKGTDSAVIALLRKRVIP